jgi:glutamate N-acetyltransferase/amino-acid N-acetyltransferase
MLAPNMATMLAFVATDASIEQPDLHAIANRVVSRTFNRISVDACESTNDSVFFLSSGRAQSVDPLELEQGLTTVCAALAEAMVRDAEGGSRVVRITVTGATDEGAGERLARAVASSALWRAAVFGKDPNWGRIVSALGSADRTLDLAALMVSLGGIPVFSAGEPIVGADARPAMDKDEIEVECTLGGPGPTVEFLTSDLSPEYVLLNAEGST